MRTHNVLPRRSDENDDQNGSHTTCTDSLHLPHHSYCDNTTPQDQLAGSAAFDLATSSAPGRSSLSWPPATAEVAPGSTSQLAATTNSNSAGFRSRRCTSQSHPPTTPFPHAEFR
ncbi:hypothetical protein K439DRAFT_291684 [Ramaria rubella]|nr:hypothetical protein K439DRAFT_291684 [Ramaria rubella]